MKEKSDAIIDLLALQLKKQGVDNTVINKTLNRHNATTVNEGDVSTTQTKSVSIQAAEEQEAAQGYYTTGPNPIVLDDNEFRKFGFGFEAGVVNIRTSNDILVSFSSRPESDASQIRILSSESPFSLGGERAIGADEVWIKPVNPSTTSPEVQVLAY